MAGRWSAVSVLGSCGDSTYTDQAPQATGDGWSTASLADVGLDPEPFVDLLESVEDDEARAVHGIVVVKNDKLVFEEYFDGYRFRLRRSSVLRRASRLRHREPAQSQVGHQGGDGSSGRASG